jgi:hypothetical protein
MQNQVTTDSPTVLFINEYYILQITFYSVVAEKIIISNNLPFTISPNHGVAQKQTCNDDK